MTRHTIAATVRGLRFALRADWSDPASEIEIDAGASVDAPDGLEWQETGETVADCGDPDALPLALVVQGREVGMAPGAIANAAAALAVAASVHFDDWRAPDLTAAAVLAAATITTEEPEA